MDAPETRYAKSGDVSIAYQVFGAGEVALVYAPPFISHVELIWDEPIAVRFLEALASFTRVVMLDKRGTGLSDRVPIADLPTLEQRMDDFRAVMDAAAIERAAIFGASGAGPESVLFAATYPDRTHSLILWSTYPRSIQDDDFPQGWLPADAAEGRARAIREVWEKGDFDVSPLAGDLGDDDQRRVQRWWARYCRSAASPGAVEALTLMGNDMDVRPVLPSIRVSTLCLARADDENAPATRYMADHILGAKYVELAGSAHVPYFGEQEPVLQEIQEFLTGVRSSLEPDRVLATVLFTDIVSSTEKAAELGDRRWRELLERHHAAIRSEFARFRGKEIDTAGDGFFASFDGPARAIRCACAITESVRDFGLELRAGVHTGECDLVDGKVAGIAVHIGARVAASAQPGEVLVSQTVKDLVAGSGLTFDDRGTQELKGVPGEWRLYAVATSA